MSKRTKLLTITTLAIAAVIVTLQPTVEVTHSSLIINTSMSSAIVDNHGAAIALPAFRTTCGVDTTMWCDIATR